MRALGALGAVLVAMAIAGCGGGSDAGGGGGGSGLLASNQVAVKVDAGVARFVNMPTVSVTICGNHGVCQTIDNIQVDTMSYGLRIVNTAAAGVLSSLPYVTNGSGSMIAECTGFADGYTWGSVRRASVRLGGKTAASVPVAIIGDMDVSTTPSLCAQQGVPENTVADLGANGILGVGVAPYDCGSACVSAVSSSPYFACPGGSGCTRTTIALADQVANPIVKFPGDNNGILLAMPGVGSTGAASATGTLTFGIGTQSNNALSGVQVLGTDAGGNLNGNFGGSSITAFFDSGSNGHFFSDSSIAQCLSGWYCPVSPVTRLLSVSNVSGAAASTTVTLPIANANTLFNSRNFAFNNLGGGGFGPFFDVGMPFFYGRTVYFGYDMRAVGGTQTPYVAF